jgi:polyphenol oxidase
MSLGAMNKIIIFFGDKTSCNVDYTSTSFEGFCQAFAARYGLNKILFNKQVHGANGFVIDSASTSQGFKNMHFEGDFLITDQKNVGIGILTADCLPILFYDQKNNIITAIHAGWRSSVLNICHAAVDIMNKKYGTLAQNLNIYFGPSAKSCCYEVQSDFLENLELLTFKDKIVQKRNEKLFFDNVLLNKILLKNIGINEQKINCDYNFCTICNRNFNSYRRDSRTNLRQISFISLMES